MLYLYVAHVIHELYLEQEDELICYKQVKSKQANFVKS